ncbi:unnamed protein product [Rotaria socialis]
MVSKSIQREPSTYLVSAGDEPNQILKPIKGFATEPLVSLEEACQPLLGIIRRLKHYAHDAKNLTQDESAAIRLYTMQWDSKLGGPHVSLYSHLNCILRQPDGKINTNNIYSYFLNKRIRCVLNVSVSIFRNTYISVHNILRCKTIFLIHQNQP